MTLLYLCLYFLVGFVEFMAVFHAFPKKYDELTKAVDEIDDLASESEAVKIFAITVAVIIVITIWPYFVIRRLLK